MYKLLYSRTVWSWAICCSNQISIKNDTGKPTDYLINLLLTNLINILRVDKGQGIWLLEVWVRQCT